MNFTTTGPTYFCAQRRNLNGSVTLFGVPFDATVSLRPGTRFGADAIRSCSEGLESYSPLLDRDLEDYDFADWGNVEFTASPEIIGKEIAEATHEILEDGGKPIMLGGEHSITPHAVREVFKQYPNLILIQMDAHADLRDGYNGQHFSHASAMRRCLDFLPANQLFQFGIRSGTREEFAEMRQAKRLLRTPDDLRKALSQFPESQPIYLTIDLDVFDPSLFPGTGTPEFGGINWQTFEEILLILKNRRLVAADAVELSPALDASGCSDLLAAKVVRELVLLMSEPFVG